MNECGKCHTLKAVIFLVKEEELLFYDQAEKYEATYIASMDQKFAEGEKSALLKVAKNMLQQGLSSKDVQKITGLSQQEMSSIQQ